MQRFLPDGPLALLPLRDGRVSLVWTTSPDAAQELKTASPAEFSRRVTEASDRVLGTVELDSERAVTRSRCGTRASTCGRAWRWS